MIPVSLSLRNFLSYGEQVPTLDFSQFRVACLTGDNGHGKSALLDAITYALWGEARKGAHDRKPDAGLLRLGTDEMRVEFCFDLDAERYRVIRSFHKTRRTSSAQLELQILAPDTGTFRSLSEGNSLTRTQQRIEQLLSMDYDTFINSAFIVQGKADEFTQKSARQRKETLAEILGLGRYDRLQKLARTHLQDRNQQAQQRQHRLDQMDAELADASIYGQQLKETTSQLASLVVVIEEEERRLEELREQRLERTQLHQQSEDIEREFKQLELRSDALEKEQQHLQLQRRKDDEILAERQRIERDFETYQQLRAEGGRLDEKAQQLRTLENAISALDAKIIQARHEVEQRRDKWNIRSQDLERRREEHASLLAQAEGIEERYTQLVGLRQQEQSLEQKRLQYDTHRQEQTRFQHDIALEKQRLVSQQSALRDQLEDLRQRLAGWDDLAERRSIAEKEAAALQLLVAERDRLRERGSALHARIDHQKQQVETRATELEKAREKVHLLHTAPTAQCPLCGSNLDELHRRQLDGELARQEREQTDLLVQENQSVEQLENELQQMRGQYQHLDKQAASLQDLQQELADLTARQTQLQETRIEFQRLEATLSNLTQRLESGQYAADWRQRLAQVDSEVAEIGYKPEQHTAVREALQEQLPAETERARLRDAQTQVDKLATELQEARKKQALAQQYLDEKLYAQREQEERQAAADRLHQLAYDPEAHRSLRQRIDELSDTVALRERLTAAQERYASSEEAIDRNQGELADLRQRRQEIDTRGATLQQRWDELAGVEQRFAELDDRLGQRRATRDGLLQQQGSLQARVDRCARLTDEREKLRQQLTDTRREAWVYQQLTDAFGKDGIQALVIENAIPEIERETNAILARLTDNRIQITIDSLRDLKKGGTRETLDIKIADEVGERSYHLYSGGEAFRTNFALRIALSRVLAMRAGTQLRTLIIDEGFGTQDSQGLEQLVEAIQEISKDFDKVLVVTHLPELKNVFPVQVEVTKHPHTGSTFQIIHSG